MRDRRLSFAVLSAAAVGSSGNRYDSTQGWQIITIIGLPGVSIFHPVNVVSFFCSTEAVLGTMMCLNADGNCPGPNSDAWNAALQAWLRNLDVRVPELSRTAVAVRITDPSADAVTEEEEEGNEDEELVAAEEGIIKDVSPEGTPRRN